MASSKNDEAFANAAFIPDGDTYPQRWAEASAAFRATARVEVDVPYGSSDRQVFDLFHPDGPARGTVIFVHGGYWKAFDHRLWSHLAAGPLAEGWAVAMPGYDLCPDVRIGEITQQIKEAVLEIAAMRPGPIVLTGHSAGGHLVARMLDPALGLGLGARLARVLPISPLSDLEPLLETSMNEVLGLDAEEARAESPIYQPKPETDVLVWVGAEERPAFIHQAVRLGEAWNGPVMEDAGRHHFDVIDGLADPRSMLVSALIGGL